MERRIQYSTCFLLSLNCNVGSQIMVENRDFCLPHLHSTPPSRGPSPNITITQTFGIKKTTLWVWWCGYPMVKKLKIWLLTLIQYTNVTDSKTDRRIDNARRHRPRLRIASRDKSYNKCSQHSLLIQPSLCRPTIALPLVYCPVDNTSFEVSPEIRCSCVSYLSTCYINTNHQVGHDKLTIVYDAVLNLHQLCRIIVVGSVVRHRRWKIYDASLEIVSC